MIPFFFTSYVHNHDDVLDQDLVCNPSGLNDTLDRIDVTEGNDNNLSSVDIPVVSDGTGNTPNNDRGNDESETTRKSRKRTRHPEQWLCNVAKRQRCAGQEYIGRGGMVKAARKIKTLKSCTTCKYSCATSISDTERVKLHTDFWALDDAGKRHFYDMNTVFSRTISKRTKREESRRQNSIYYFFTMDGNKIQVCKQFFCGTLDIGAKRVEYFHKHHKNSVTGTVVTPRQGCHQKKVIKDPLKCGVRKFLDSLPRVESHYCRSSTKREYLESGLSISSLFDRYVKWCQDKNLSTVKKHMFSYIFNTEYNMAFLQPKKDRCDLCEITERQKKETGSVSNSDAFHVHGTLVKESREERNRDKDSQALVICFDMQNVLTLPKADISNFFYRQKLSCYNLTAHVSKDKSAYCCLWTEALCGRKGNDIASALMKILEDIIARFPEERNFILWSDSCVPQNKNSIMSLAIHNFMKKHPSIENITQKFSTRGHSCIQEVDSVHSVIERALSTAELFSPVSLVRLLTNIRKRSKVFVIQMRRSDFKDFQKATKSLFYKDIPYCDLKELCYHRAQPFHIGYKTRHGEEERLVSIRPRPKTRKDTSSTAIANFPAIPDQQFSTTSSLLSKEKLKDIQAMLEYLPVDERIYMKAHCGLN